MGVWIGLSPRGPRSAGSNPTPRKCSDIAPRSFIVTLLYGASRLWSRMIASRGSGAGEGLSWVPAARLGFGSSLSYGPSGENGVVPSAWLMPAVRGTGRKHKGSPTDRLSHRPCQVSSPSLYPFVPYIIPLCFYRCLLR